MSWNVLNNSAALATVIHRRNFSFRCWTGGLRNGHFRVRDLEERESASWSVTENVTYLVFKGGIA